MKPLPLFVGLTVALAGANALPGQTSARHKVESEIVGPPWVPGMIYTLSAKGSRLATTYTKDGKWFVAIDNVDGEPFDDILKVVCQVVPQFNDAGVVIGQSISPAGPVALSPDGTRHAYAGRRGDQVVVIVDGKEVFRAKDSRVAPPVSLLQFSPDGKHVFFYQQTGDTLQTSFRLMMDGKPATPAFDRTPPIFFSPDGSRWLLNGTRPKQILEKFLVIDGKEQSFPAERGRFSPDGKKVICTTGGRMEQKLLVDGKVVLDTKATIERFRISATGDIAVIVQKMQHDQNQQLYLNGKLVAGVEGIQDIVFSPDGKRWAARCTRDMNSIAWYVVDGKKGQEYKEVSRTVWFSPDSSKCVYVGDNGPKKFLVVNGEEDQGNAVVRGLVFGRTGGKFAYGAGPNTLSVHHDGKVWGPYRNVFALEISPDGSRVAYFTQNSPTWSDFHVDGELKGGGGAFGDPMVFSPDSKHLAGRAMSKEGGTIYINGRFLPARRVNGTPVEFTPDSRHLIVEGSAPDEHNLQMGLKAWFIDGEMVARFSPRGITWANTPSRLRRAVGALPWGVSTANDDSKEWESRADGRVVFVGPAPSKPPEYGPMTRITVTPSPDTSFETWFDDVKAAEEQEAAAALVRKEKAAADKAEAAAKAKAAAAEAAAKRKAAAEAAAAAKAKARADAAAAKAAARQKK